MDGARVLDVVDPAQRPHGLRAKLGRAGDEGMGDRQELRDVLALVRRGGGGFGLGRGVLRHGGHRELGPDAEDDARAAPDPSCAYGSGDSSSGLHHETHVALALGEGHHYHGLGEGFRNLLQPRALHRVHLVRDRQLLGQPRLLGGERRPRQTGGRSHAKIRHGSSLGGIQLHRHLRHLPQDRRRAPLRGCRAALRLLGLRLRGRPHERLADQAAHLGWQPGHGLGHAPAVPL
mmetsp:Transcript_73337/g.237518  ORF Transcript_73337/g.237518 Transcript_73337/m.237518 type:complete len:233 (+) Transcript_73337:635-1333(+)